ncbi:uncharacterized protein [Typha latifolia]|uniref:uncharacterized protein isoform X2 n=1 Tax=Typha latifolia TaxID=4733 RepID=UPI003C2AC9FA
MRKCILSVIVILLVTLSHGHAIEPISMDQGNKLAFIQDQPSEASITEEALADPSHEESLYDDTDLNIDESIRSINNMQVLLNEFSPEIEDKACLNCREAVKDIISEVRTPKMRMKILKIILPYCEELDDYEDQCKKRVRRFIAPLLSNLDKLKTNDICRLAGLCDEGISY